MPRRKKPRGRPSTRRYPPRIDATAEEIAQAVLQARPLEAPLDTEKVYFCAACGREICYPEVLYRDGKCAEHTGRPVVG